MPFLKHQNFEEMCTKFSHLLYERTNGDRDLINKSLDDFNNLNYRYPIIQNTTKALLLINNCCTLIPPDDEELSPKCCRIITNLINMQNLIVEGKTLLTCVEWLLQTLKQTSNNTNVCLIALNSLLTHHKHNFDLFIPKLLAANSPLLKLTTNDQPIDVILNAVRCLETCTEPLDNKIHLNEEQMELCVGIFHFYLLNNETGLRDFDEILYSKLLISCINGVKNLIQYNPNYMTRELGILLGITKSYMVFGIKGVPFYKPIKLMPANLSIPDILVNPVKQKRGGKLAKHRKHRISNVECREHSDLYGEEFFGQYTSSALQESETSVTTAKYVTSESDYSDSDNSKGLKRDAIQARVRQDALNLFYRLVNLNDKKTLFSYWSNFVPDGNPSVGSHSLTTCILRDPSAACRMAALNVLLSLLISSKLFLAQAEYSEKTTSFTPFSIELGYILKELHRCLCLALNENSTSVLIQVLKCIAGLVQATPYHRLSKGMIRKLVRNIKVLVYHKNPCVQVAALIVTGCIFAKEPVIDETRAVFIKKSPDKVASTSANCEESSSIDSEYVNFSSDDEDEGNSPDNESQIPWILERCLQNLGKDLPDDQENNVRIPLREESLRVLCAMSRNHIGSLMGPHLMDIAKVLKRVLCEKRPDVHVYGAKAIDFIGQALANYFTNNTDSVKHITYEEGLKFWLHLLDEPLINLLQNENDASLRAFGCDCLGSIGVDIFEHLPRETQLLIITLLFACSRDESSSVMGAALRSLGICVLYPSMRQDTGFVVDVAETLLRTYTNESPNVRDKCSWSLANLSRTLVLNREKRDSDDVEEEFPSKLFVQLLIAAISLCYDHDKIKCSAARSIGPLLQLVTETDIRKDRFKELVDDAIKALVKNCKEGSIMKVKWNSCYSFSIMLKNDVLFLNNNSWKESVYSTLIELVKDHKNFKVRTNAAIALASPSTKQIYGNHYYSAWNALIKALENSQNMDDISEYKHRDNLVEQICLSLAHLTTLLDLNDLSVIEEAINSQADLVKLHMHKVLDKSLSEKSTNIFLARQHLINLKPINDRQSNVIKLLSEICQNDV